MKNFTYKILLNKEPEGSYTVTVPALPGCITYGENIDHAISMAKEARSEERRVGKECRSRRSQNHEKKKNSIEREGGRTKVTHTECELGTMNEKVKALR